MGAIAGITTALVFGFLPPLLWLWFWLKEDIHPEPKREILVVFFAGMVSVLAAIVLESVFYEMGGFIQKIAILGFISFHVVTLIVFAFIEEIVKAAAAFFTAFKTPLVDEPVDAMIYLVTAALGFAALENALFIAETVKAGIHQSILVSAFRFSNAVLIHISASSIVGAGFAFSFFHRKRRPVEVFFALIMATFIHFLYNFFVLGSEGSVVNQLIATAIVGLGAIIALLLFERARCCIVK
jgi:protease PrsW